MGADEDQRARRGGTRQHLGVGQRDALAQFVCADPRRVQHLGRQFALPADELALDLPEAGDRQRWKGTRQVAANDAAA